MASHGHIVSREAASPKENKTKLINNEALLQGWSEKAFSNDETRKAWKQATKKNSLTSLTQKLGLS